MTPDRSTTGKLLTDAEAEGFGFVFRDYNESKDTPSSVLIAYGQFFVADRQARVEREKKVQELLEAISDKRMWRETGCGTTWEGATPNGNEIETRTPIEIANEALSLFSA